MLIQLSSEVTEKCMSFAQECVHTNKYYASRGQANVDKIINDIFVGKCGEWASYEFLKLHYDNIQLPDLAIYRGGKKSHSADLMSNDVLFSVKTQSLESVKLYGMSWLMEKSSLPKFLNHNVVLCLEISFGQILIQNIVPFADMLLVQAEPRLKHLKTKCAFYYSDMLKKNIR